MNQVRVRAASDEEARFFKLPVGRTGVQIIEVGGQLSARTNAPSGLPSPATRPTVTALRTT